MNICGVVVRAERDKAQHIQKILESHPGVEVHAIGDNGNIVVTVEDASSRMAADTIASFNDIEGVYAANLVYHEIENSQTPQEAHP